MSVREQIAEFRRDAEFTRDRIGAPGCEVRQRAERLIQLLDGYEAAYERGWREGLEEAANIAEEHEACCNGHNIAERIRALGGEGGTG